MGKEFYSIASVAVKNQMNIFVNVQSSCVVSESRGGQEKCEFD